VQVTTPDNISTLRSTLLPQVGQQLFEGQLAMDSPEFLKSIKQMCNGALMSNILEQVGVGGVRGFRTL
jgi:hypothetical protein